MYEERSEPAHCRNKSSTAGFVIFTVACIRHDNVLAVNIYAYGNISLIVLRANVHLQLTCWYEWICFFFIRFLAIQTRDWCDVFIYFINFGSSTVSCLFLNLYYFYLLWLYTFSSPFIHPLRYILNFWIKHSDLIPTCLVTD